LSPWTAL